MDKLSKEQLLLLQDNLSYSVYERFMDMFPKHEVLPNDSESFYKKIISMMKEHHYWGETIGWGGSRKYIRISNNKDRIIKQYEKYKDKSSEKFVEWLDNNALWEDSLIEESMLSVED